MHVGRIYGDLSKKWFEICEGFTYILKNSKLNMQKIYSDIGVACSNVSMIDYPLIQVGSEFIPRITQ